MAATPIKMNKVVELYIRTGERTFKAFRLIAWKCRASADLEVLSVDGDKVTKVSCSCVKFKAESKCDHSAALIGGVSYAATSHDGWSEIETVGTMRATLKRTALIADDVHGLGVLAVVHPSLPDLNLVNFGWLMSNAVTEGIRAQTGTLRPQRLFDESVLSVEKGFTFEHAEVTAKGKACTATQSEDDVKHIITEFGLSEFKGFAHVSGGIPMGESSEPEPPASKAPSKAKPWNDIKRPDPSTFYVDRDTWTQMVYGMLNGKNILLTGPSGSGKSELCYQVAAACGRKLEAFNMGAMSEPRTSLIGNTHFDREKGTWFAMSRFARGVQTPNGVILLDEMTRSDRGAFNILLPLLDRQGYLALDESEDATVIRKAEGVCFLVTANIGMEYTGTEAMDKAVLDRNAIVIDMQFPPAASEVQVLLGRCHGLSNLLAKRLVDLAESQRQLWRSGDMQTAISTRMLIEAGEQISRGMDFKLACRFCVENHFSNEGDDDSERTKVKQLVQKGG
jgi:cobaltochelatase CobS